MAEDFPGGEVDKNTPANAGDMSSIPGQGAKISHALWPQKKIIIIIIKQNIKQKQYCKEFNKDFKNGAC